MTTSSESVELARIRDQLRQEANRLQIVGRALTDAEMARIDAIERAVPLLDQAIALLSDGGSVPGGGS
jgi:hypothetical protein